MSEEIKMFSGLAEQPEQYLFGFAAETETLSTTALSIDAMHYSHKVGEIGELQFDIWAISNGLNAWRSINPHTKIDRIVAMNDGTFRGFHIKTCTFQKNNNRYQFKASSDPDTFPADYWFLVGLNGDLGVAFKLIVPFEKFGHDQAIVISNTYIQDYVEYLKVPSEFVI
jgi:hypothetical protein